MGRWEWRILIAILVVSAVLRFFYMRQYLADPAMPIPVVDAQFHDYWAQAQATGNWTVPAGFSDPLIQYHPYTRPPAYTYFLSLVYMLPGPRVRMAIMAQVALGLLNVVLVWRLGRWMFGRVAGLIASAAMGWYWLLIFFEGELLDPTLTVTVSLLMLLAFKNWTVRMLWRHALLTGALFGLLALTRSNFLVFLPLGMVGMALVARSRMKLRRAVIHVALFALGTAAAIAPVTWRNWRVGGEFVLISANGGINLYIGNNTNADLEAACIPELQELLHASTWSMFDYLHIVRAVERKLGRRVGFSGTSRYFTDRALAFIHENPRQFLHLTARRAVQLLAPVEYSNNKVILLERLQYPVLRWLPGNFSIIFAMAAAGLCRIWALCRRGDRRAPLRNHNKFALFMFALGFALSVYLSYLFFFMEARFRIPMIPVLAIVAAWWLVEMARLARRKEWIRVALWLCAATAIHGLFWWSSSKYKPDEAYWHSTRAWQYMIAGDMRRYRAELEESLRCNPKQPEAAFKLGDLVMKAGNRDVAIRLYEWALELNPAYTMAYARLGAAFAAGGNYEKARQALMRGVKQDPGNELIRGQLGEIARKQGLKAAEIQRMWDELNGNGQGLGDR